MIEDGHRYGSWELVHAPQLGIPTDYYGADEFVEIIGERGVVMVTRCSAKLYDEAPVVAAGRTVSRT